MIKNKDFLGTLAISPNCEVEAGSYGSWKFTYTVGKYGFDDVGSIKLCWRNASDWGLPQFTNPKGAGFSTVSSNNKDVVLTPTFEAFQRPYFNCVSIKLSNASLKEGDVVEIVLGNTEFGSPGIRSQTFVESQHEFKLYVDCFATNVMTPIEESVYISVVNGVFHKAEAVLKPLVHLNQEFSFTLRALDEFGNACKSFTGDVILSIPTLDSNSYELPEKITFSENDKGLKKIVGKIKKPCHFVIKTTFPEGFSYSNSSKAVEKTDFNMYVGDLHGQNALTVGSGSMEEYFSFARDVAAIDFTGWQGNDFEIDNKKWEEVRSSTHQFYDKNNFVTLLGYEWSGNTPRGGDYNVYFLNDNKHFHPSSNCIANKHLVDVSLNAPTLFDLHKIFEGRNDVLLTPHIGGRAGNLDFYNKDFTSVIEIHSHHGTFEWFALEAMKRRLKVGFICTSDDHTCRPGLSYPIGDSANPLANFGVHSGYTCVFAKELSREGIWEAIKNRRCYGSDGGKINLDVRIDNHYMGEEINYNKDVVLDIETSGSSPIDTIQLYNWDKLIKTESFMKKQEKEIRISWSGVTSRGRKKVATWDGEISVINGKFINAKEYAFDKIEQGITYKSNTNIKFHSTTSGDYDGLVISLVADNSTVIKFNSPNIDFEINYCDIKNEPIIFPTGKENLKVEVVLANETIEDEIEYLNACVQKISIPLGVPTEKENAYWVRVLLNDGHMAWSSPIFLNTK